LQRKDPAAVRELFKAGANVNARDAGGSNALHVAANFRGDLDLLKLLLDQGANVNAVNRVGQTPLTLALQHAHYRQEAKGERLVQVASLRLSRGASAKGAGTRGALPLRAAMDPVNLPLIELLLKHGAEVPDDGLDWSLSNAYTHLIRLLMARPTCWTTVSWTG
jgi:ankyrin repeat protein